MAHQCVDCGRDISDIEARIGMTRCYMCDAGIRRQGETAPAKPRPSEPVGIESADAPSEATSSQPSFETPMAKVWAQERRGAVGCGVIGIAAAVGIGAAAYFFAPAWLFWAVAVMAVLLALFAISAAISQLRRTRIFYREAKGEWRTGKARRRTSAEVEAIWRELAARQKTLVDTVIGAVGAKEAAYQSRLGQAMEEAGKGTAKYWACLEILNDYENKVQSLRTLVRDLLPTEPPQGTVIEMMEQWLSLIVDDCKQFRAQFVLKDKWTPFENELIGLVASHYPPPQLHDAVAALPRGP